MIPSESQTTFAPYPSTRNPAITTPATASLYAKKEPGSQPSYTHVGNGWPPYGRSSVRFASGSSVGGMGGLGGIGGYDDFSFRRPVSYRTFP